MFASSSEKKVSRWKSDYNPRRKLTPVPFSPPLVCYGLGLGREGIAIGVVGDTWFRQKKNIHCRTVTSSNAEMTVIQLNAATSETTTGEGGKDENVEGGGKKTKLTIKTKNSARVEV